MIGERDGLRLALDEALSQCADALVGKRREEERAAALREQIAAREFGRGRAR